MENKEYILKLSVYHFNTSYVEWCSDLGLNPWTDLDYDAFSLYKWRKWQSNPLGFLFKYPDHLTKILIAIDSRTF